MTLREKQSIFAELVAVLLMGAKDMGYTVTLGEAYRSPEEAARLAKAGKGIAKSLHTQRLAVDLHLFRNGKYLTKSEDYRPLGEFWEEQSTDDYTCSWGGRFIDAQGKPKPDGGHFSLAHGGRQ